MSTVMIVRARRVATFGFAIALVALAVISGCDPSAGNRSETGSTAMEAAEAQAAKPASPANQPAKAAGLPDTRADTTQRRSELQTQMAAVQLQKSTLQQEHARISALVQSHQNESEQKLAAFKAQFQALQEREASAAHPSGEHARFAEQARNELEAALALDQEYLAQLGEVRGMLEETDSQLIQLQTALDALQDAAVVEDRDD